MLMYAYGHIKDNPLQATDIYTEQCAVSVNAKDLATWRPRWPTAAKPVTGKQVTKSDNVPEILAVMATAGLYDDTGKWLYRTGLPGRAALAAASSRPPRQVRDRGHLAAARRRGQQRPGAEGDRRHLERPWRNPLASKPR